MMRVEDARGQEEYGQEECVVERPSQESRSTRYLNTPRARAKRRQGPPAVLSEPKTSAARTRRRRGRIRGNAEAAWASARGPHERRHGGRTVVGAWGIRSRCDGADHRCGGRTVVGTEVVRNMARRPPGGCTARSSARRPHERRHGAAQALSRRAKRPSARRSPGHRRRGRIRGSAKAAWVSARGPHERRHEGRTVVGAWGIQSRCHGADCWRGGRTVIGTEAARYMARRPPGGGNARSSARRPHERRHGAVQTLSRRAKRPSARRPQNLIT
jgi:hypothetical protein